MKNKKFLRQIAAALNLIAGETVIEIGPGHGELTKELLTKPRTKIIVIEKDKRLVAKLKENFQIPISNFQTNSNNRGLKLEIIEGDVLKKLKPLIENCELKIENYKLVGNIPYYLTGRLLRIISELKPRPALTVLTVQAEVGERLMAKPPKMNLLAASVQVWAKPKIIAYISKKEFQPAPKVDSAVIRLKPVKKDFLNAEKYYALLKILFKQPRKTVLNNLLAAKLASRTDLIARLEKIKINPYARPQNLGLNQLKNLAEMLYN